ncbi:FAD-binding oxidoreductase [Nocardiopsis tropica]|uniref:FAD-binding oxidoreductase n=1 Tax=Nocardiopsis tropica TaxID=109330 RepID=A0ABV1ZQE9_9ACTN
MTPAEKLQVEGCALRRGTADDAVGTLVPGYVARPADADALARIMAVSGRRGLTVVARGHGTAMDWGGVPRSADLVVDTGGLSWIDHIAGDLVVEVGAGTPVADLFAVLEAAGQRLSVDPVREGGTVGGMVATGVSGPRRLLTGALRDLVIGMTVVRADGVVARSGGRVVKNVAGYDLAKLHTGGLGTLGVIASVAFRLHPLPPALRVVTIPLASRGHAERITAALRATTVVPAAVELHWPSRLPPPPSTDASGAAQPTRLPPPPSTDASGAAQPTRLPPPPSTDASGAAQPTRLPPPPPTDADRTAPAPPSPAVPHHGPCLRVVLEGTPEGLEARTATVLSVLRGAEPREGAAPPGPRVDRELPAGWGLLPSEGTVVRVSVPPAESAEAAEALGALAGRAHGTDAVVTGSVPRGALFVSFAPGAPAGAVADTVAGARSRPGWSATLLRAEPHVHAAGVDPWGEIPGLPLMRAVRDSFDPGRRLAPGRFADGA